MAELDLRRRLRNRYAAVARDAGGLALAAIRDATPRSTVTTVHTADRWTVDHRAAGPDLFVETIANPSPVVNYLEEGTRPHEIRPRNRRALRFDVGGTIVFARKVQHPGTPATHFAQQTLTPGLWRACVATALARASG